MDSSQKQQYQMLVRLRDFGAAHKARFPESSPAGQMFAAIAAAIAAMDQYLVRRVLARAEGQKVRPDTRGVVLESLKAIAATARRIGFKAPDINPFLVPRRRSFSALISTGRAFSVEAEKRQAEFVRLGMPATFVSDLKTAVDELEQSVTLQLNSRTLRLEAPASLEQALADALNLVRDLDMILANSLRQDPVTLATYRGARRLSRKQASASSESADPDVETREAVATSAEPPDRATSPAGELPKAS